MATVEMASGTTFDPDAFGRFLTEQPDLGTKWAPRFVRVVEDIPVTATRKIDKKDLRRQSWTVEDAVYLGDTKTHEYHRMDDDEKAALLAEYDRYGRSPA